MSFSIVDPVEFSKTLMACRSITPHEGGALGVLESALIPMGFECHRVTFSNEGEEPTENLYARLGSESPNLCYAGHVDVVPPGDYTRWKFPPFEPTIEDGILYGRGAEDMKGSIACFIAAVSQFLTKNETLNGSLSFLITCDEEGSGINGTKPMLGWLKKKGEVIDTCLVGEPTNPEVLGTMIKVGRRGSVNSWLEVHGVQGHVAYPEKAENPITRLVKMLDRLKAEQIDGGSEFFPPSNLEVVSVDVDNDIDNLIPANATARFNIRFNDQHDRESIVAWIREQCEMVGGDYALKTNISGDSFLCSDPSLAHIIQDASEAVTGLRPELSTTGGTSDARFIKDVCPVIEFGTTGPTAHKVDECVAVKTLEDLALIYEETLKRFFS